MNWRILGPVLIVNLVILAGIGYFVFTKFYASPKAGSAEENTKILNEVGKLIDLPVGEQPTIATINDIDKLKGQSAFEGAKTGDKVIIYTQAKKAIIYDPVAKKIINVAPVNVGTPSAQQNASSSASPQ